MSHDMRMMFALSEFTGYVADSRMYAANSPIAAAVKTAAHAHRARRAERGVTAPARPVRSGSGTAAAPATPCAGPVMG